MLLFIAFVCFSLLFIGWIVAPTSAPAKTTEAAPSKSVPETGTSPA